MAAIDFSLQNRNPDGNGKLLVGDLSPTDGSYTTESQYKNWIQQDIIDGTITAKKAERDQNGNVIDTTYETKEDAGDIKEQVSSNSTRIANLEDKSGPFTIDYPSTDYGKGQVPANIAKGATGTEVEGNTRGWNQLCPNNVLTTKTVSDVTITNNGDGSYTLNGTASADIAEYLTGAINLPIGHKILYGYVNINTAITGLLMRDQYSFASTGTTMIWQCSVSTSAFAVIIANGTALNNVKIIPIIRDLTLIFGAGNEPSTVASAVALLPDLMKVDSFGYSLPSVEAKGLKFVGVNLWDEDWEVGSIDNSTGLPVSDSSNIRAKNFTRVVPSTAYYFMTSSGKDIRYYWYDINQNFISSSYAQNVSATSPSNAFYLKIRTTASYGSTYNHDIQICLNSLPNDVKTAYHPYKTSQTLFSETVTLRSAGTGTNTVREKFYPQTGRTTHPIGSYTFTGSETWSNPSANVYNMTLTGAKWTNNSTIGNAIMPFYVCNTVNHTVGNDMEFGIGTNGLLWIHDSSCANTSALNTKLTGKTIYFELATPDADTYIALAGSSLEVEPYGEISVIQDQSPKLDTCFSVQYIPDSPYLMKKDVVDNLISTATDLPLSANMGRVLNETLKVHAAEIENLKQTSAQTELMVSYPDDGGSYFPDLVPAKAATNAEVVRIVGKSRPWNNITKALNANNWTTEFGASVSYSDGVATLTPAYQYGRLACKVAYVANHKILTSAKIKLSNTSDVLDVTLAIYGVDNVHDGVRYAQATTEWQTITAIVSSSSSSSNNRIMITDARTSDWGTIQIKDVICRDLTVMFPEGVPSTIAECVQKCPDILKYDAYGYSLVDTTVEGVESISRNRLKPSTFKARLIELGGTDNGNGTVTISAGQLTGNVIWENDTSSDRISFCFAGSGEANLYVLYESGATEWLDILTTNGTWKTSQNGQRVAKLMGGWASGNSTFTIAKCGIFTGSTSTWSDYSEDTLSLPTPVTLRSAGSVAEEYDLESGEKTNPLKTVNMSTDMTWSYNSGYGAYISQTLASEIKIPASQSTVPDATSDKYLAVAQNTSESGDHFIVLGNGHVWVFKPNDGNNPSGTLTYALATPDDLTQLTPIIDNFIKVEGGGTVNTKQTQSPVIDNSMDANFDLIP